MNDQKMLYEKYGRDIALGINFTPPTPEATLDEVTVVCKEFIETYTRNGYAYPVISSSNIHPEFFKVMYALSREYLS